MTSAVASPIPASWNLVDEAYAERGVHFMHPYARDAIALAAPAADARVLDVAAAAPAPWPCWSPPRSRRSPPSTSPRR